MSELISGKGALIALANGQDVECRAYEKNWINANNKHHPLSLFFDDSFQFRLKHRTITINGIEVPVPFEPKCMEDFYVIDGTHSQGWINGNPANPRLSMGNPKWRTEAEIKQVVAALRSVFNENS